MRVVKPESKKKGSQVLDGGGTATQVLAFLALDLFT